jgi:hypothetical protein
MPLRQDSSGKTEALAQGSYGYQIVFIRKLCQDYPFIAMEKNSLGAGRLPKNLQL